jgi:hypothetical protein
MSSSRQNIGDLAPMVSCGGSNDMVAAVKLEQVTVAAARDVAVVMVVGY